MQITYRVARHCPLLGSHSFTGCWLSLEPVAISPLIGCQSTERTSAPCPLSTLSSWQWAKSHMRAVESSEPVTNLTSVGAKLKQWAEMSNQDYRDRGEEGIGIEEGLGLRRYSARAVTEWGIRG